MTLASTDLRTRPDEHGRAATPSRHWSLPNRQIIRTYLFYAATIGCLFVIGYGGANWLAAHHAKPLAIYWSAELNIPLVPEMIWIYLSIDLLFLLPPFRLDHVELQMLGRRMIIATLISVAIFIAMPTTLGFARLDLTATPNTALRLLYALDAPFNCLPSLHVAYSALIISALAQQSGVWLKLALGVWFLSIMASTLLTHQHHLADIVAAFLIVGGLHLRSITAVSLIGCRERQS
ncbi:MAG TPA: phosphatase PAP2 family protein [Dongiaceae bacterium]|nr:phosphatase PAP2 family protein [Dongiaceae bacterium]